MPTFINWRNYVTFEVNSSVRDIAKSRGLDPNIFILPAKLQADIESVMDEFAQTPEGAETIRQAAKKGIDGKINFLANSQGITGATHHPYTGIYIGTSDTTLRYADSSGNRHNFSLQRILFHELQHHVLNHEIKRGDENQNGFSFSKEVEAIKPEDDFMRKYYNEPERIHRWMLPDLLGTPEWDINKNFRPSGYPLKPGTQPEQRRVSVDDNPETLFADNRDTMGVSVVIADKGPAANNETFRPTPKVSSHPTFSV